MDKMRSMEVFVRVVDAGSFSAAARTLDMSTVMVSKHIAALEQLVGARLLHRTTRSQSLSEIGQQYAEQCRHILQLVQAAETGALAMRTVPRGTLKVSAPAAFGSRCLAPAMAEYLELHPEVNLELDLSNRLSDLVEEGLDAAIRIGPLPDSTLVARPLTALQMMVCAAPSYLARHGTPRTPGELAQHRCLDFSHWRHNTRWQFGAKEGTKEGATPNCRMRSNNGEALRLAAVAGLGLVMQADAVLADEIAAGRLQPILREYWPQPRPMHLIYPRDRQSTPKLASFVEFVVERFGT